MWRPHYVYKATEFNLNRMVLGGVNGTVKLPRVYAMPIIIGDRLLTRKTPIFVSVDDFMRGIRVADRKAVSKAAIEKLRSSALRGDDTETT